MAIVGFVIPDTSLRRGPRMVHRTPGNWSTTRSDSFGVSFRSHGTREGEKPCRTRSKCRRHQRNEALLACANSCTHLPRGTDDVSKPVERILLYWMTAARAHVHFTRVVSSSICDAFETRATPMSPACRLAHAGCSLNPPKECLKTTTEGIQLLSNGSNDS